MPLPANILWLTLEDTSPRLGCFGDSLARTPHIDALAASGRRYPLAFSTAAVCAPSRFAIITGMYATAMGAHQMRTGQRRPHAPELPVPYAPVPPPYVRPLPEYLRAADYYCTNNAKTDYQFEPPCTMWDECGREAHFRHRAPGQPFFAVFNMDGTHESGMWPRPGHALQTDPARVALPPYLPDTPAVREALARHYDNLAAADARVGSILAQLEEDGVADETAVFLWSDHGEGLPRGKRHPYDSGTRVPLIVRWPGRIPPGEVADGRLASMIDLPPTVLEVAGIPVPRHLQGRSLLDPAGREHVFTAHDRHDEAPDMVRAVRDRRHRYVRNFLPGSPLFLWTPYRTRHPAMQELWRLHAEGGLGPEAEALFSPRPPEELYDLESDPHELRNLADDPGHRDVLERLRAALEAWRRDCGDLGDLPEEQVAARMWPGGLQPRTAAPRLIPLGPGCPGTEPAPDGGAYPGPVLLQLHTSTAGAAMEYALGAEPGARWRLYAAPVALPPGRTEVRARAGRIGYHDSPEVRATFIVGPEAGLSALEGLLRRWCEDRADALRRAGHSGTDAELAARHAAAHDPAALAAELAAVPGWWPGAVRVSDAAALGSLAASVLGGDGPGAAALGLALRRALGGSG